MSGRLRLTLVATSAAVVWLVVLPQVGEVEQVRARIEHNESRGIDPAAKFYTELPMMGRVLERIRGGQEGITTELTEIAEANQEGLKHRDTETRR